MSEYLLWSFLELNQIDVVTLITFSHKYKSDINMFKYFLIMLMEVIATVCLISYFWFLLFSFHFDYNFKLAISLEMKSLSIEICEFLT